MASPPAYAPILAPKRWLLRANIAEKNPDAVRAAKRLFNIAAAGRRSQCLLAESREQARLIGSANQTEAVMANLEKARAAIFRRRRVSNPVLVEVFRSGLVESRHRGAVAVIDADGTVVLADRRHRKTGVSAFGG